MNNHNDGKKFVLGALFGAISGAVLGVLFAPRSGKETRKMVKDRAEEVERKVRR